MLHAMPLVFNQSLAAGVTTERFVIVSVFDESGRDRSVSSVMTRSLRCSAVGTDPMAASKVEPIGSKQNPSADAGRRGARSIRFQLRTGTFRLGSVRGLNDLGIDDTEHGPANRRVFETEKVSNCCTIAGDQHILPCPGTDCVDNEKRRSIGLSRSSANG